MHQSDHDGNFTNQVNQKSLVTSWQEKLTDAPSSLSSSITKGFPTAVWKLPNDNKINGLIDLRADENETLEELESSVSGFIVNPFESHHPSKPSLLKADILFSWELSERSKPQVTLSPTLSATQLENFESASSAAADDLSEKQLQHMTDADFERMVEQAVSEIHTDRLSKVVISRYKDVRLPSNFDVISFFEKACASYPNAFCYVAYTPAHGLWMGATPETLLSLNEEGLFETMSLAGTQKLEDKSLQDIAWTQKEIEEQAMVSRYVIDCFKKIRLREFQEIGPKTSRAGNLAHLKTTYSVDTQKVGVEDLGTTMMNLLHPTSAVCGMPLLESLSFIKQEEKYDRGLYAGFLGPVNIQQSTRLFVNLRCMQLLDPTTARLYAGAGITADSNPHKEFIETEMKMNTLRKLLNS